MSATVTLTAVADTYVSSTAPAVSYSTAQGLVMDKAGSYERRPYIAFDLSSVPGMITGAQLQLRVTQAGTAPAVIRSSAPFTDAMTWNTRATVDPAGYWTLPSITNVPAGQDAAANVTKIAKAAAGNTLRLAVAGTSYGTPVTYASRETATPPRLIVTYDAPPAAAMAAAPIDPGLFAPVWGQKLAPDAPVHANSDTWAANLRAQMHWPDGGAYMGLANFTGAHLVYVVPAGTPLTPLTVRNATAAGVAGPELDKVLRQGVPLPDGWHFGHPSGDNQLAIYQPSSKRYWDLQGLDIISSSVFWGGYMQDATKSPGHFQNIHDAQWVFSQRNNWGASATSLPLAAGIITREDIQTGAIQHAISMAVGMADCSTFLYPAQRHDCRTSTVPVPEGARFRFPASVDVDAYIARFRTQTKLTLEQRAAAERFLRMLIIAGRDYGFIVSDQTGGGVCPYFRDYVPTDGQVSWNGLMPCSPLVWPFEYMRSLPWDQAQVVTPA